MHEKVSIKEYERFKFPSKHSAKRKELVDIIKKYGKWEEVDQLDIAALNKLIQEKRWTGDVLDILKEYVELDKSKRLYVSKIKN